MPVTYKILLTLLLTFSASLQADRLNVPGHFESGNYVAMPQRGINMDRVLSEFGEPEQRIAAIGDPPITEWDYGAFRVYFEHRIVLHSLDLTTLIMPE